jgi:hypothetical protein
MSYSHQKSCQNVGGGSPRLLPCDDSRNSHTSSTGGERGHLASILPLQDIQMSVDRLISPVTAAMHKNREECQLKHGTGPGEHKPLERHAHKGKPRQSYHYEASLRPYDMDVDSPPCCHSPVPHYHSPSCCVPSPEYYLSCRDRPRLPSPQESSRRKGKRRETDEEVYHREMEDHNPHLSILFKRMEDEGIDPSFMDFLVDNDLAQIAVGQLLSKLEEKESRITFLKAEVDRLHHLQESVTGTLRSTLSKQLAPRDDPIPGEDRPIKRAYQPVGAHTPPYSGGQVSGYSSVSSSVPPLMPAFSSRLASPYQSFGDH